MLLQLAYNWFLVFYSILAFLLLWQGMIWLINPGPFYNYLRDAARSEHRPSMLLKSARYLFLFSTVSLIFGFITRSVIDILFSLGLVSLAFVMLNFLGRWKDLRMLIPDQPVRLQRFFRYLGLFALSTTLVLILLIYRLVVFS